MEALEEKYVKYDSFEEVDRILTIVENSKIEFEQARRRLSRLSIASLALMVLTAIAVFTMSTPKDEIFTLLANGDVSILAMYAFPLLLSCFNLVMFFYASGTVNQTNKQLSSYKATISRATEILRELIPTLSKSEQWTVLRQLELNLRLSKLGIDSEAMFSERSF